MTQGKMTCPRCQGAGRVYVFLFSLRCTLCKGEGQTEESIGQEWQTQYWREQRES